jgi:hypothetical protein
MLTIGEETKTNGPIQDARCQILTPEGTKAGAGPRGKVHDQKRWDIRILILPVSFDQNVSRR